MLASGGLRQRLQPRLRLVTAPSRQHQPRRVRPSVAPAACTRPAGRRRSCAVRVCRRTACSRAGRLRRRSRAGLPRVRRAVHDRPPGRHTVMRRRGTPSRRWTSPAVNAEIDNHMIGPEHVLLHERAVVAAHLGPGPLGMREEIEIVDVTTLGGMLRRNQRRPRRVDHVEAPRPASPRAAIPGGATPVEHRTGTRASTTRTPSRSRRSTRSFQELEKSVSSSPGWRTGCKRPEQPEDILADTRALAQRRPVVDQDAHGRHSAVQAPHVPASRESRRLAWLTPA